MSGRMMKPIGSQIGKVGSLVPAPQVPEREVGRSEESEVEGVKLALRQWVSALNAGSLPQLSEVVTDDVVISQAPAIAFSGKPA